MIADLLKKAVLQAAIQGKLTEQLPEDGDARDLLEDIKTEKESLIKEGKITKEKPLTEINDDEMPFDIPENWCWVRLEDVVDLIMGQSPDGISVGDKGIEFHQGKKAFGNKIIQNSNRFCSDPKKIAEPNSILLCVRAPVGKVNLTDREICIGRGLAALSPISSNIYYLYYLLLVFEDYFIQQSTGTTFKAISKKIVRQTIIPLPPLAEQQRIVEKLEEFLPEMESLSVDENKLDTLQQIFPGEMKSSILQAAIQGRLTKQLPEDGDAIDFLEEIKAEKERLIKERKIKKEKPLPEIIEEEIPFNIPDNWCWVRFGELISLISGTSFSKNDVTSSGIRILRGGNIDDKTNQILILDDDFFIPSRFKNTEKEVIKEDIIIVGSTGSSTVIGKPAIASENMPNVQIGAFLRIIRPIKSNISNYLHMIIKSNYYRQHISSMIQGTNIYNIRSNFITDMLVPLPPLSEQQRIVAHLEELLPLCDALE